MKHAMILSVSVLALSLSACGKKAEPVDEATTGAGTSAMASDAAVAPALSPAQTFANAAAASDAFEIEASRLAAEKGAAAKTKTFAERMIKAHTESTAKLKAATATATPPLTPDPMLTSVQQQTLDTLKSKSGAEFDTAFAKAQVDGHQMTLDALKAYSASGDVPSLKAFAAEMVPIVTAHLNMAKGL